MLAAKNCIPCKGDMLPLPQKDAEKLLEEVPSWALAHGGKAIFRKYAFADFNSAYAFASKVAELAQAENHHPDIGFGWGYVKLKLWTHVIGGLHENDFIMAAKINALTQAE
jgi:4a-hydroxytetrahydrobiopterin dehydratase